MRKETKHIKDSGCVQRAGDTVGLQILKIGLANKIHVTGVETQMGWPDWHQRSQTAWAQRGIPSDLYTVNWRALILALVSTLGQELRLDVDILKFSAALTLPWLRPH